MKTFNLEKALAGEFVKLRSGGKALITYCVPEKYKYADGSSSHYPLQGIMFDKFGNVQNTYTMWRINGMHTYYEHPYDIIGMWEEPKLTSEQVLEKAYQENLPLDAIGKKAFVIAKTKDGDYVMQCGEDNLYFASHETMWEFYKDPAQNPTTEKIMEKALQKGLTVKYKIQNYYAKLKVIAKTTSNDYVLQNTKYGSNVYLLSNFPEHQWELEE